jgi:hypothetical protein
VPDASCTSPLSIKIKNLQGYTFSDSTGGSDSVQTENVFKHDPGIGGLVLDTDGSPVAKVNVKVLNSSGSVVGNVSTDADGWYMWAYKYTGKASTFTVKLPAYGLSQSVTMKSNAFLIVDFTVPVSASSTLMQSASLLQPSISARSASGSPLLRFFDSLWVAFTEPHRSATITLGPGS